MIHLLNKISQLPPLHFAAYTSLYGKVFSLSNVLYIIGLRWNKVLLHPEKGYIFQKKKRLSK